MSGLIRVAERIGDYALFQKLTGTLYTLNSDP